MSCDRQRRLAKYSVLKWEAAIMFAVCSQDNKILVNVAMKS
jgi:hypothetical protein